MNIKIEELLPYIVHDNGTLAYDLVGVVTEKYIADNITLLSIHFPEYSFKSVKIDNTMFKFSKNFFSLVSEILLSSVEKYKEPSIIIIDKYKDIGKPVLILKLKESDHKPSIKKIKKYGISNKIFDINIIDVDTIYNIVLSEALLGEKILEERPWIPLCKDYPNLKGITCEDVNNVELYRRILQKFSSIILSDLAPCTLPNEQTKDCYLKAVKTIINHDLESLIKLANELYNVSKNDYIVMKIRDLIRKKIQDLTRNYDLEDYDIPKYSEIDKEDIENAIIEFIDKNKLYDFLPDIIYGFSYHTYISPTDTKVVSFMKKYFSHVRVYDRREEYIALKKIGERINKDFGFDVLHDISSVFITTPRGGHEILSIFSYANNISKEQIPSDILELEDDYIIGRDWLFNRSENIKRVFVVDDIIASGHQMNEVSENVLQIIPNAEIYTVMLCDRYGATDYSLDTIKKRYFDTKTIGIERFIDKYNDIPTLSDGYIDNIWITCVFPHACPDGDSDIPMQLLLGERCKQAGRIKRDEM